MGNYQKPKRRTGMKQKLVRVIVVLVLLTAVGGGLYFYRQYLEEQKRLAALEEQRRLEEQEKERLAKLLEEKRREFDALVAAMKKYYEAGDFAKAREAGYKALEIAKEYNFETDEIYRIFRLMDVAENLAKLKNLDRMNWDIYRYLYVRTETLKIPDWTELKERREAILEKTYQNEYLVKLALSRENVLAAKKGSQVEFYYLASRDHLDKAIQLRRKYNLAMSDQESVIRNMQKELFFGSKELTEITIPQRLY